MQLTYHYFWVWRREETWQKIHNALLVPVRQAAGREATPSGAIINSQSVKTTEKAAKVRLRKAAWGFVAWGFVKEG